MLDDKELNAKLAAVRAAGGEVPDDIEARLRAGETVAVTVRIASSCARLSRSSLPAFVAEPPVMVRMTSPLAGAGITAPGAIVPLATCVSAAAPGTFAELFEPPQPAARSATRPSATSALTARR